MPPRPPDLAGFGAWPREPGTVMRRASAVPAGAAAPFVIISESHVPGAPTEWEPHTHPLHELVWVRGDAGRLGVAVGARRLSLAELRDAVGRWEHVLLLPVPDGSLDAMSLVGQDGVRGAVRIGGRGGVR
ncbi:hypothetical protein [Streptomyces cyaneofuscatus]|uniref:hypothetical protein n=1 Tax=Streptomyces cyaneofuscatus TaxID=66883 RepID=UPI00364CE884